MAKKAKRPAASLAKVPVRGFARTARGGALRGVAPFKIPPEKEILRVLSFAVAHVARRYGIRIPDAEDVVYQAVERVLRLKRPDTSFETAVVNAACGIGSRFHKRAAKRAGMPIENLDGLPDHREGASERLTALCAEPQFAGKLEACLDEEETKYLRALLNGCKRREIAKLLNVDATTASAARKRLLYKALKLAKKLGLK
jgi:hypothetical protein